MASQVMQLVTVVRDVTRPGPPAGTPETGNEEPDLRNWRRLESALVGDRRCRLGGVWKEFQKRAEGKK